MDWLGEPCFLYSTLPLIKRLKIFKGLNLDVARVWFVMMAMIKQGLVGQPSRTFLLFSGANNMGSVLPVGVTIGPEVIDNK